MIGKGSLEQSTFNAIKNYGIENRVKYIEAVPNKEIHQYYKACDFFVNFNEKEIFGMSILEAMYQGCIVVAKKAPGPCFIIEDKSSGYLITTNEEAKMAIIQHEHNSIKCS